MTHLTFDVASWIRTEYGAEEEKATSGWLRVCLGNEPATRVDDEWSKSVRDEIFVSVYPLAVWIVASWWRLLYEPIPDVDPPTNWRMAHELGAAGHGFLWPRIRFSSDGEWVETRSWPSTSERGGPLRYLTRAHIRVPLREFETALTEFITLVVRRLDVVGLQDSTLQQVWADILAERGDIEAMAWRRLEARLGFDADDAPESLMLRVQDLAATAGASATEEIASVCAQGDRLKTLGEIVDFSQSAGATFRFVDVGNLRVACAESAGMTPWERGWHLARTLRTQSGLDGRPLTNDILGDWLGVTSTFIEREVPTRKAPLALAIREGDSGEGRLLLRKRHPTARRFESARLYLDHFSSASAAERWLPATDAKTVRQKVQRAFAAELLAPIDELRAAVSKDDSDESIEDAAVHFNVSPLLVRSHLANSGVILPEAVDAALYER